MRAIFLDRDGVLNRKAPEGAYITTVREFEILPGAPEAIVEFERCGYEVFIVTNQRGIARGLVSRSELSLIHRRLVDAVQRAGGDIKQIYVCSHDIIDNCDCRKPKPGLLLQAQRDYWVQLHDSWMIGDSSCDILAGKRAGCLTGLVGQPGVEPSADVCAPSLPEIVQEVKRFTGARCATQSRPV